MHLVLLSYVKKSQKCILLQKCCYGTWIQEPVLGGADLFKEPRRILMGVNKEFTGGTIWCPIYHQYFYCSNKFWKVVSFSIKQLGVQCLSVIIWLINSTYESQRQQIIWKSRQYFVERIWMDIIKINRPRYCVYYWLNKKQTRAFWPKWNFVRGRVWVL